jgi:hypothetical protein
MKIWNWKTDANNFDYLIVPKEKDVEKLVNFYKFDGTTIMNCWEPVQVDVYDKIKRSDTPTFNSGPVLSERGVAILKDLICGSAEILPLKYKREQYYVLNVTNILDCIDYSKAQYIPFSSSGRPMVFTNYAFKYEAVKNEHIFKIIEHPKSNVFVSDYFRNRVIESGLVGFRFEEVWNSEK